jgi:hypothetical protein
MVDLKAVKNKDGWRNVVTGLGTKRDKNIYSETEWNRTPRDVSEALFSADEIGAKSAKIIPYDGTREGITWNMDRNSEHEDVVKFLESEFKRLNAWETFAWAWTLARVYGGSTIFLSVDDGARKLDKPLNMAKVKKINTLTVFDRWELHITSSDIISDLSDPNYGTPEFYTYQASNSAGNDSGDNIRIHHTRLIRFDGVMLPMRLFKRNNYWHDSIYGTLFQAIRNYATVHDAVAIILSEFNQPVFHIEGLSMAIEQDEDELILKKLETVNLMRSTARAVVLDKEDLFTNVSTNVAGGKDLIDLTVQRLVAGIDVPHTRLLGNSPTGLGGTGQSELINYYDNVKAQQQVNLRSPIEVLTDVIFAQAGAETRPEDLAFEFNPLFQLDQEKELRTRQMQADIDETYVNAGVYDTHEVANSRFATGKYRYETVLEDGDGEAKPRREPPQAKEAAMSKGDEKALGAVSSVKARGDTRPGVSDSE